MSPDSAAQYLLVVEALFNFVLKAGDLAHQPWALLGRAPRTADKPSDASEQFTERSLDARQWAWLIEGLQPAADDLQARLAVVLWLGYACGLRAAEMLSLTLGSLQASAGGWCLRVLGKGRKARTVPCPLRPEMPCWPTCRRWASAWPRRCRRHSPRATCRAWFRRDARRGFAAAPGP